MEPEPSTKSWAKSGGLITDEIEREGSRARSAIALGRRNGGGADDFTRLENRVGDVRAGEYGDIDRARGVRVRRHNWCRVRFVQHTEVMPPANRPNAIRTTATRRTRKMFRIPLSPPLKSRAMYRSSNPPTDRGIRQRLHRAFRGRRQRFMSPRTNRLDKKQPTPQEKRQNTCFILHQLYHQNGKLQPLDLAESARFTVRKLCDSAPDDEDPHAIRGGRRRPLRPISPVFHHHERSPPADGFMRE